MSVPGDRSLGLLTAGWVGEMNRLHSNRGKNWNISTARAVLLSVAFTFATSFA